MFCSINLYINIMLSIQEEIKKAGRKVVSKRPHFAHGEAHTSKREQGP
jgi:hypothetical protein